MSEKVTVHGFVVDASGKSIAMIRVFAIQKGREVERTFTDNSGSYSFEVPRGLTTLSFDASASLANATDWHPSVVANIDTNVEGTSLRCDRVLMKDGTATSEEACVDALAGYMFSLMWTAHLPDSNYAKAAAARLLSMKMPSPELDQFRSQLRELFAKRAKQE